MDPRHKDHIRKHYMQLIDGIKPAIENVCIFLYSHKIISKHMYEDIVESRGNDRNKSMKLLDLIVTRGPHAYEALYRAVFGEALHSAADILMPDRQPHAPVPDFASEKQAETGYESPDEALPDIWPCEEAILSYKEVRKCVESSHCKKYKKSLTVEGQEFIYPLRHKNRGRCLILNNFEFDHLSPREGTNRDRQGLENLFGDLGFDHEVQKNKTCEQMEDILNKEAKHPAHAKADCFVLFILSHGHTGVVFGTDGCKDKNGPPKNCIKIKDIRDQFCKEPALRGKPKFIFIQACQGVKIDEGLSVGDSIDGPTHMASGTSSPMISQNAGLPESEDTSNDRDLQSVKQTAEDLKEEQSDSVSDKTPTQADVFVAMATTADYLSWRNTAHGTWFIQAVVYIFARFAYKYEINKLMSMVNNLVSRAATKKKQYKQVGECISTLSKEFYFFPGLYDRE